MTDTIDDAVDSTSPRRVSRSAALVAALIDEAETAASAGRRPLARQHYESALYLLRAPSQAGAASTILRRIGRTYLDDGDFAAAQDCLEAALAIAEANDDAGAVAHTTNVMAISYWQRGQLEHAERLYGEASRLAAVSQDARLAAMIEQNLGVIASMRGDVATALGHHASSVAKYRALGMRQELGRELCNVGLAYTGLGQWPEAEDAYRESREIAAACGDVWGRLMVGVNRVALLVAQRDFGSAREACAVIEREATQLDEKRVLAETYKLSGIIARETRQLDDAERLLRLAYDQAMAREDLLLAAETSREQAELYLVLGRNRDTLQTLSQAHALFTRLKARHELADVSLRLRNLEHRFEDLVRQWAQSIESKDVYTLGHCERVADYACAIAVDMEFDETTLFWFRVGALLHDVGKIVVPVEILNKAGPLTPDERAIMERHPTAGVELLRDVEFPWDVLPMVRGHHERWDGHGYPDQLAGDAIPLSARILCVADVFDALTTDRPYRKAYSPEEAARLMLADIGRAFDPEILTRFFRLVPDIAERRKVQEENRNAGGVTARRPRSSADSTQRSRSASDSVSPILR
ncbi:MAG TPA: HD-GYP domain-containing protein [Gemmatimonadaceae bacterium]|nr:HD-GYP domain-containing protein [Gemmatimonadaceae bacterium]